jgi:hypothetical protein
MRFVFIAIILAITSSGYCREWKDKSGKFSIDAECVGFDGEKVDLKKQDGSISHVDLEKLSKDDADYIYEHPKTGIGIAMLPCSEALSKLKTTISKEDFQSVFQNIPVTAKSGFIVSHVIPNCPADNLRIQRLDVITTINGKPVKKGMLGYLPTDKGTEITGFRVSSENPIPNKKPINAAAKKSNPQNQIVKRKWEPFKVSLVAIPVEKLDEIKKNTCPLKIERLSLSRNSIDQPELTVKVKNISSVKIVAYKLDFAAWDKFGDPVKKFGFGSSETRGISQESIPPGQEDNPTWTLHGQETAAKFKISVSRIKLENDEEWKPIAGYEEEQTYTLVEK